MSAAPRYPAHLGYAGLRMTATDFLSLGETDECYELLDGVVIMSPSPLLAHQRIVREILYQLETYRRNHPTTEVVAETDVCFSASTVYRPDLVAYRAFAPPSDPTKLTTVPDLVIEVLSPATKARDLITKRDDYERFGVGEYWAVDPADGRVRCWRRAEGCLIESPATGDALPSAALPGFSLDLRAIRDLSGVR